MATMHSCGFRRRGNNFALSLTYTTNIFLNLSLFAAGIRGAFKLLGYICRCDLEV